MTVYSDAGHLLETSHGRGRTITARPLRVPPMVAIDGDRLVWEGVVREAGGRRLGARQVAIPPDLLARFVALADAPDAHIERFARRYGVLMICEHGLPCSHQRATPVRRVVDRATVDQLIEAGVMSIVAPLLEPVSDCYPLGWREATTWEPIATWRRFSRHAGALLQLAAHVHQGGPTTRRAAEARRAAHAPLWKVVYDRDPARVDAWKVDTSGECGRWSLMEVVQEWLVLGDVRPRPEWGAADATISLSGTGLFGALAVQLAFAVCQADGFASCSACGTPFVPQRRPAPGRRTYCEDCRAEGKPVRDAARAYRARQQRA